MTVPSDVRHNDIPPESAATPSARATRYAYVPRWLSDTANNLLTVEHEIRTALRAMSRPGGPHQASTSGGRWGVRCITIGEYEARTLLRGAMPAPIVAAQMREPHARLIVALSTFGAHLVMLNDAGQPLDVAAAAAVDLSDELGRWLRVVRWVAASRQAGAKWPPPEDVAGPPAPSAAPDLPYAGDTPAVGQHLRMTPRRQLREVAALRAEQVGRDLNPNAEVVDHRQLGLALGG